VPATIPPLSILEVKPHKGVEPGPPGIDGLSVRTSDLIRNIVYFRARQTGAEILVKSNFVPYIGPKPPDEKLAVYGPVCTVVWQGSAGNRCPMPINRIYQSQGRGVACLVGSAPGASLMLHVDNARRAFFKPDQYGGRFASRRLSQAGCANRLHQGLADQERAVNPSVAPR
jgi:hypothetical protein